MHWICHPIRHAIFGIVQDTVIADARIIDRIAWIQPVFVADHVQGRSGVGRRSARRVSRYLHVGCREGGGRFEAIQFDGITICFTALQNFLRMPGKGLPLKGEVDGQCFRLSGGEKHPRCLLLRGTSRHGQFNVAR